MTPTPRRTTATLLTGFAVATALALTGCTPDDPTPAWTTPPKTASPTPTPTPTPTVELTTVQTPPPKSEEEALEGVEATLERYNAMLNLVFSEGGKDPERIAAFAIPPALQNDADSAKTVSDLGYVVTGASTLEFQSGAAVTFPDNGNDVPFGSATVRACFDSSKRSVKTPDGADAPTPPESRTIRNITALYLSEKSAWFIRTFEKESTTC